MTNTRKRLLAPALAVPILMLSGCGGNARGGSLSEAVADYEAQRYTRAYERAVPLTTSSAANVRAEASYVAGLSAYKMGQQDEAERRLLVAAASTDAALAARASAMLGVIRIDQLRYREAVTLLEKAHPMLLGEDAQHAARQLAYAHQHTGDSDEAQRWQARASGSINSHVTSSETRHHQVSTDLFALQIGAFKNQQHAESAASLAARDVDRLGLGPMRIVPSRDDRGQVLFLVQFGSFPTRASAASTRDRLGKLNYIVAPLAIPAT
jgi:tetratricopeptide (TPR) repeat protein